MTKKEMFAQVAIVVENSAVENKDEMLAFINHEIDLLTRKSSGSKPTKVQLENEILMDKLVCAFAEMTTPVTISEFQKLSSHEVATLNNQKISSLLKKLCDGENPRMKREVEKKKAYFSLV